ncbi:MAG: tRNA 5-methoxyuridine(34)/uridine 5-oxyacetic acid(34) synthase CmoB, partial [Gammaproteobacteria bacterium]|nr:tRNA 5-methoxyuridine(34)/uridine 5-oxyacetic acid(34) synthase CmoB [Gammaproteobacteria bacterium]
MTDIEFLFKHLRDIGCAEWENIIKPEIMAWMSPKRHGNLNHWLEAVEKLPVDKDIIFDLTQDAVTMSVADVSEFTVIETKNALMQLMPWRKGPFNINSVFVDSEWRSNLKWNRLAPFIGDLEDKNILDIGCGNGYYAWRMLGLGARSVTGVDPSALFYCQYLAVKKFLNTLPFAFVPLASELLPKNSPNFDFVFSMGVLYHRREPAEHIGELKSFLNNSGTLVLETLIVDGIEESYLKPKERYAKMRNVWNLPTVPMLKK